jgi:hypothetical protein
LSVQKTLPPVAASVERTTDNAQRTTAKPVVPAGVAEYYLPSQGPAPTLAPRILGVARLHFIDKAAGIDAWETRSWLAPLDESVAKPDWAAADVAGDLRAQLSSAAPANAAYSAAPAALLHAANYAAWARDLASHIYESANITVFRCPQIGASVAPAGDEGEFRSRLAFALREKRDAEIDRLRRKYAPRITALEDQIRRAEERIERERSQLSQQKMQTAISVGTSILGALLGRKKISVTNAGRIGTAARNAGRIGRESGDVARAEEGREALEQRLREMQNELEQEVARLQGELDPQTVKLERVEVKPRKSDIDVTTVALAWVPARSG